MKAAFVKKFIVFSAFILSVALIYSQEKAVPEKAAAIALNDKVPVDPKITIGEFENGLKYYIRENRKPEKRAELRLIVNAGSILEDEDQLGLAHFTEHMAFNGTEHFEKQELISFMESIGMRFGSGVNAYTGFDNTVYMLYVPTDTAAVMETAFQIMEDWAHGLAFNHEEIDKERGVVIEEWRLGQGAGARMRDKQFPILLKDSRYAERLPIGKKEIIENFNYETLKRFYKDWYRPDLMAVIAVGDFEKDNIESLIKKHFSKIPKQKNPRPREIFDIPDHEETLFAIATDKEATGTSVAVYYKQPLRDQSTVGAYRQSIVENIYNNMLNQRLQELTQRSNPPFIGAYSDQSIFIGTKEAYTLSAAVDEKGIRRGLDALLTEAERVILFGFTPSELERHKKEILRQMEQAYTEREKTYSSSFAAEYIRNFFEGEPIPGIEFEFELFKRFVPGITLDEINKLASEWLIDNNRVILVNAPEKPDLEIPPEEELAGIFETVKEKDIAQYVDKVIEKSLIGSLPETGEIINESVIEEVGVTEWKLSNGIRVSIKPTDFQEDQVLFQAFSPGGTSLSSDDDYIAAATSTFVIPYGGLSDFNFIDLRKMLAGKVVSVAPYFSGEEEGLSGSASPKDLETMFQLIYLTLVKPRADETIFSSLQTRLKSLIKNRSANPETALQDTLQTTFAQYHCRVRPLTEKLLEEMNLNKSYSFYKDRFADTGDFTFVFVGNIDPEEIKPLVKKYLGSLPSINREETWRNLGIDFPRDIVKKDVFKGKEPKSRTIIVFPGDFVYNREHLYSLRSLTELLEIRLREKIREDLSGTYGVNVNFNASIIPDQEYSISISFGTDPERVKELTNVVFEEINYLKSTDINAEYITKVREAQKREWETNLKQNNYWLTQIVYRYRDRENPDLKEILTYGKMFETLDTKLIKDAAIKYINLENYIQVSLYPEKEK